MWQMVTQLWYCALHCRGLHLYSCKMSLCYKWEHVWKLLKQRTRKLWSQLNCLVDLKWRLLICKVNTNNTNTNVYYVCGAVIMAYHCERLPTSFQKYRLSARWPPTLKPSQLTWDESPPVGCHHPLSQLIIILPSHGGWKAEST